MKKLIAIISILVLLAAGYGIFQFTKKTPSLVKVIPEYTITADDLYRDFDSDEKNALLKYNGKVVQVTGEVEIISMTDSVSNVMLRAENALMGGINCSFNKLSENIQKDDKVTIKGQCQGFLMSVILNNCVLVK